MSTEHPDPQVQTIRDALATTSRPDAAARNRADVYKRAQFPADTTDQGK